MHTKLLIRNSLSPELQIVLCSMFIIVNSFALFPYTIHQESMYYLTILNIFLNIYAVILLLFINSNLFKMLSIITISMFFISNFMLIFITMISCNGSLSCQLSFNFRFLYPFFAKTGMYIFITGIIIANIMEFMDIRNVTNLLHKKK